MQVLPVIYRQERQCTICGSTFVISGGQQKYCLICAPDKNWQGRCYRYGFGRPQWDELLESQGGTCALCNKVPTCVDHCHATGRI